MKKYSNMKEMFNKRQKLGILISVILTIAIFICIGILICY